jgi:hypothetical protein
MSRLDSAIRRLHAQRDCLNALADVIAGVDGVVFELGLGNGRTFDHLRSLMPARDIYAFEREVRAHPDCIPDADHLFEGDFSETLPAVAARFEGAVALIHADVGSGDVAASKALAAWLKDVVPPFLAPGGVLACDQDLTGIGLDPLALPDGVPEGRYFLYRRPPV